MEENNGVIVGGNDMGKTEEYFPLDIWICVYSYLDIKYRSKMCKVSKYFISLFASKYILKVLTTYDIVNWAYYDKMDNMEFHLGHAPDYLIDRIGNKLDKVKKISFGITSFGSDDLVSKMINLERLQLHRGCSITNVGLSTLTRLTTLRLSENATIRGEWISEIPNLRKLSLIRKTEVTDYDLGRLTNLRNLRLFRNTYITGETFSKLSNITALSLVHTDTVTDLELKWLSNLTYLDLEHNNSVTLEGCNLPHLKTLTLGHMSLVTDNALSRFTSITTLNLWGTKNITSKSCKELINLIDLNISNNGIMKIEELCFLPKLVSLNLDACNITNDIVKLFTNITDLSLTNNSFVIAEGIKPLTKLVSLHGKCIQVSEYTKWAALFGKV